MQHTPEEIARAIANGHGYKKHVIDQHEFDGSKKRCGPDTGVKTREEYEAHILKTITKPDIHAFIGDDKAAHFYDRETNTHVIYDPSRDDLGTCMRPTGQERPIQKEWDQDCKNRGWQLSRFQDSGLEQSTPAPVREGQEREGQTVPERQPQPARDGPIAADHIQKDEGRKQRELTAEQRERYEQWQQVEQARERSRDKDRDL